jgi:hypothetical protein
MTLGAGCACGEEVGTVVLVGCLLRRVGLMRAARGLHVRGSMAKGLTIA